MRWFIALIVILLAFFYFLPEPEQKPVEETFIGEQVKVLRKAENYEEEYLQATKERQQQMEEELEKQTGG